MKYLHDLFFEVVVVEDCFLFDDVVVDFEAEGFPKKDNKELLFFISASLVTLKKKQNSKNLKKKIIIKIS